MDYKMSTKWVLCFLLQASSVVSDFTYWADKSCLDKFGDNGAMLEKIVKESSQNYGYGRDRLSRQYIEEPQAYNNWMDMLRTESFKGTPTFDERKKLFLDRITDASKYVKEGELDEERARNISEVRVYCDNEPETRFKLVADDKILYKDLPPDTPVNSLRDANMQEWEDIINKVRHKGTPGCWRPPVNGFVTLAHSSNLVAESDPYQNEYRLVVTFCDHWFNHVQRFNTWEELEARNRLPEHVDDFFSIGSHVFSHEIMHGWRYRSVDFAYSFAKMIELDDVRAMYNAETSASYAGLMRMMEHKMTLEVDQNYNLMDGWLQEDLTIPDRVPVTRKMKKSDPFTCENGNAVRAEKGLVCKEFDG